MNPREKTLLVIVGVGLALLAAWAGSSYYARKTDELATQLRYEQGRLKAANDKLALAQDKTREWKDFGGQTFSMDPMVATGQFRTELVNLANRVDLPVPQPTEVSPGTPRTQGRNGVRILLYTVKTEGTLPQLTRFMFELHRQPYLVRCKSLRLEPVLNKPANRGGKGTPTGRLRLTMSVETPILPPDRQVPRLETAQLAPDKRQPVPRTLLASAGEYAGAIKEELFKPYVSATVERPPESKHGSGTSKVVKKEWDPREKPADAELVLARVLSSPRSQQIVLEDRLHKTVPDKRVKLGDPLYLGKLIYVDPTGAVSEVARDKTRLYHPIGLALEQGQRLSATEHPAVFEAVSRKDKSVAIGSRKWDRSSESDLGDFPSSWLRVTDASRWSTAAVIGTGRESDSRN